MNLNLNLLAVKILSLFFLLLIPLSKINAQMDSVAVPVSEEEIFGIFDVSLEEIMSVGMVSASKKKQSVLDAPAYAYVFTRDMIELRGYSNLLELINSIPEVELQKNSNPEFRNMVTFRGVPGAEKFLILQNGVRITPSTGDFYTLGHNYSLINAERVEVILGPASALYGVDAFSGVINIITTNQEGQIYEGGEIRSSLGNFGTSEVSFLLGTRIDQLKLTVSGSRYHSEEPDYYNYYPDDYAWYTEQFRPNGTVVESPYYPALYNIRFFENSGGSRFTGDTISRNFEMPTDAHYLNAEIGYKGFSFGYMRNYEAHSSAHGINPKYTSYDRDARMKSQMNVFYLRHQYTSPDNRWNISTSMEQSLYSLNPSSHFASSLTRWQRGYVYSYANSSKVQVQAQVDLNSSWDITSGLSFENLSSLPRTAPSPRPFDPTRPLSIQEVYYIGAGGYENYTDSGNFSDSLAIEQIFFPLNYQIAGGFVQANWTPNKVFDFTIGGRVDYYSRYGIAFNPRFGLVIKPTKKLTLKALYGTAVLAPSPAKTFQQAGNFYRYRPFQNIAQAHYFRFPNKALEPEFLSSVDFSINYFITSNLSISANAFWTSVYNLINPYGEVTNNRLENLPKVLKNIDATKMEISVNEGLSDFYGATTKLNYLQKWGDLTLNPYLGFAYIDGGYFNFGDNLEFDENLFRPEDALEEFRYLFYQSRFTLKAGIDMTYKRLSLHANFINKDWSRTNIREVSGYNYDNFLGYRVINLNTRWTILSREKIKGSIFLKIDNLLDNRYYNVYAGNSEGMPITPQDPLRYQFGIQIKF